MYKLTVLILDKQIIYGSTMDAIIILIKRCCLTKVKLTALYTRLITKTTITYITIVVYHYRLSDNDHVQL